MTTSAAFSRRQGSDLIVIGIVLLILGWLLGISILYTVGGILLAIGLVLLLLGAVGHPLGRNHYF